MAVLESLFIRNARSHRSPLSLVLPKLRRMRFRFGEPVPMSPKLVRELAKFTRPGFHPDDIDTEDLVQEWQLKLFGANGDLVDRVR